jgi:hypothetical protein
MESSTEGDIMRIKHLGIVVVAAALFPLLAGCSDDHTTGPGFGTMNVRMTDAPGDFQHVNLVVTQVSARLQNADTTSAETDSSGGGWIVLNNTAATYDLVTLQNGTFTTIATNSIPAGRYTQLRLKIGTGSTVTVDGTTYPLEVPSGEQSGLKLVGNFDVPTNGVLDVALDFDASRSIVATGAGGYILKPVVKVLATRAAGAITGTLSPAGIPATVWALQSPDTLGSTRVAADGHFALSVLASGVYSVRVSPDSAYRDTTLNGVVVTAGSSQSLGTIQLTHE